MNAPLFLQAAWLAAPVIAAGLIHIAVIKTGALPALARIPLDRGKTFRGRRLLGENKSLRGALVMPAATIGCTLLQAALAARFAWAWDLNFVELQQESALLWGALLGLGYILGELPNSFLKRQLDIPAGAAAPGAKGALFWVLDQVDSLLGILALLCFVWAPPLRVALALVALTLILHPAIALVMFTLKLKSRIG